MDVQGLTLSELVPKQTETLEQVLSDLGRSIELLRARRSMYIGGSFEALVAFLVGYSVATRNATGVDLMELMQKHVKYGGRKEFAKIWFAYLAEDVANGDEMRATELVFDALLKFASAGLTEDSVTDAGGEPSPSEASSLP